MIAAVEITVKKCSEGALCSKVQGAAEVHICLPSYEMVKENVDGTFRVLVPVDETAGGKLDEAKLRAKYPAWDQAGCIEGAVVA